MERRSKVTDLNRIIVWQAFTYVFSSIQAVVPKKENKLSIRTPMQPPQTVHTQSLTCPAQMQNYVPTHRRFVDERIDLCVHIKHITPNTHTNPILSLVPIQSKIIFTLRAMHALHMRHHYDKTKKKKKKICEFH